MKSWQRTTAIRLGLGFGIGFGMVFAAGAVRATEPPPELPPAA